MESAETWTAGDSRFGFGKNWLKYQSLIDERRIQSAMNSLQERLGCCRLEGKRFLDIGSGSGLFSLAAARLGARVFSFDYDPMAVQATRDIKERFEPALGTWTIGQGSVLDRPYLEKLGPFEVVYSWGVLHHTGSLRLALEHAALPVAPSGQLFIAIYNDQGATSQRWRAIKRLYNRSGRVVRWILVALIGFYFEVRSTVGRLLRGENPLPFATWKRRRDQRGMSVWYDLIDWVGGYPFEVAKPQQIIEFYKELGFELEKLVSCGTGHGCNEFVFRKGAPHVL